MAMQKQTMFSDSEIDCSDCAQIRRELKEKSETLATVTRALNSFLESGDCGAASKHLLSFALQQTRSKCGFLGVVLDGPVLRILAHEGIVWHESLNRELYETKMRQHAEKGYFELEHHENLFQEIILEGKTVIANEPKIDERAKGVPPGHPRLENFLGMPIFKGAETVAVIAVANRDGGYTGEELRGLETMCQTTGVLYDSYRQSVQRAHLEEQQAKLGAEFRHSQKMEVLGQLAGGIAHDFNNSLMVLSGSAELLQRTLPANSQAGPYLEQIRRTTEKASMVTKQLLAFSRKQVLDVKPIDVHEVLTDCEFMLPRLLGSDVELTFQPEARKSWIRADAAQIEQILVNLAVNGRDAMPTGGKLTVCTRNEDRPPRPAEWAFGASELSTYLVLEIADTGCGMDEKTRARIFEPFFTTKPVGKGTGLGLSTVYGIVHQFEGSIQVESEPGAGTHFLLSFPVADSPDVGGSSVAASCARAAHVERKLTILLADDESALSLAIAEFLREAGHRVLDTQNPYDALEIAQTPGEKIDVLLTDIVMPGLRGTDLAQQVKGLHPEIHVIFMSGYAEGLPELGLPPGAVFLQKPFRFASLTEQLTLVKRKG
jgi:signal transduction histidine kinase